MLGADEGCSALAQLNDLLFQAFDVAERASGGELKKIKAERRILNIQLLELVIGYLQ